MSEPQELILKHSDMRGSAEQAVANAVSQSRYGVKVTIEELTAEDRIKELEAQLAKARELGWR